MQAHAIEEVVSSWDGASIYKTTKYWALELGFVIGRHTQVKKNAKCFHVAVAALSGSIVKSQKFFGSFFKKELLSLLSFFLRDPLIHPLLEYLQRHRPLIESHIVKGAHIETRP